TDPTTCANPTGTITVTAPAPAAGISYSIDGVDYTNTTGVFNNVAPGNYNVTVQNAAGCISAATPVTINGAPSAPPAPTVTPTDPATCANPTGTITVTAPAPAAGISYSIDGGDYSNTSGVFNNVAPGNYHVTVQNGAGWISAATPVTIGPAPSAPPAPTVTPTNPTTCANPTGTITVTAPLGAGLSYSIDGVDYTNTTGVFNNVAPGNYNVTVQNAAGCISSATPVTINGAPSAPPAPTVTPTDPTTCANPTGTITVTAPLGAGLSYSIDGIDYTNTPGVFNGVAPGTYNVTVKNAAGCISSAATATINGAPTAPAAPTVNTTDPATCTDVTGTITVTAPLGAGLSYSIDGIDYTTTTGVFNGVAPGTYNVTVQNAAGCISSATTATIDGAPAGPAAPTVATADPLTCANPTGTITVTAPLGAGLSYSIDGVDYTNTTGVFNGVAPGTYNVTVQNAAECISSATSATINGAPAGPATPTVATADPTTCATPTGTITVTAPLGAGVSYAIDVIDYTNTTGVFNGVAPGTYNVTVQNAAGCISTAATATINGAPTAPVAPTVNT